MAKDKRKKRWILAVLIPFIIAVLICVALLIVNHFVPIKYLSAYLVSSKNKAGKDEMRVTFLDVGLGDCALVELPDGKIVLIDGGDGSYTHELSILKCLNSYGVSKIDFLISTSVKGEHCGGLAEIVRLKSVDYAYIPYCTNTRITPEFHDFFSQLESSGVNYDYAHSGNGYYDEQNGVFFTFLSPSDWQGPLSEYTTMNENPTDANVENASIITWLQYNDTAFIFTSDARSSTLKTIVDKYELSKSLGEPFCKLGNFSVNLEDCKVVTVAAHGGAKNTSKTWYEIINPECAVLSVGDNFASLPSLESMADVCAYVAPIYTSEKGNIVIKVSESGYTIS